MNDLQNRFTVFTLKDADLSSLKLAESEYTGFSGHTDSNIAFLKIQVLVMKRSVSFISGMAILMAITVLISPGCGLRHAKNELATPSEADELLAQIEQKNNDVTTFKGVGRIKFRSQGKLQTSRSLWAGMKPLQFRIEILNPARQPAASIASDGKWLYLLSHGSGQFHKQRAQDADMNQFISVPVTIDDIITLLAGGVPLHSFHEAFLKPDSSGKGYVIVLKKKWRGVVEKIYLDENKADVRHVEIYNLKGLVYRVVYSNRQRAHGFMLPKNIVVTTRNGLALQMDVDKYWVNIPVSTAMFVLSPQRVD